jgi:hypothetical protein
MYDRRGTISSIGVNLRLKPICQREVLLEQSINMNFFLAFIRKLGAMQINKALIVAEKVHFLFF